MQTWSPSNFPTSFLIENFSFRWYVETIAWNRFIDGLSRITMYKNFWYPRILWLHHTRQSQPLLLMHCYEAFGQVSWPWPKLNIGRAAHLSHFMSFLQPATDRSHRGLPYPMWVSINWTFHYHLNTPTLFGVTILLWVSFLSLSRSLSSFLLLFLSRSFFINSMR